MVDSSPTVGSIVNAAWEDHKAGLPVFVPRSQRPSRSLPFSYQSTGTLLAVVDCVLIVGLGCGVDRLYRLLIHDAVGDFGLSVSMGACFALLFVLGMMAQQLYLPANILNNRSQFGPSLTTWIATSCCVMALVFLSHLSQDFSRIATVLFFVCGAVLVPGSRVAARRILGKLIAENRLAGRRRVMLIGDTSIVDVSPIRYTLQRHGYNVLGEAALPRFVAGHSLDPAFVTRLRIFVLEHRIDELFLAIDPTQDRLTDAIAGLRIFPLPVYLICGPTLNALVSRPITDLGPARAFELQRGPLTKGQRVAKRSLDLAFASVGLFALAPIMVVIALLIKLDSPGPALFRQRRAGFNRITFKIFKFRSMSTMDDGAVVQQATRDDRRVTRIGRWMRRTSVDELPQLLNVIKGDMSLVGPRPHALSHDNEYDELIATYAFRHHMKPGITGWAQVNGCRGETSTLSDMQKRVDYDLWYIKHWSIGLDLASLWRTAVQMVRPRNVY